MASEDLFDSASPAVAFEEIPCLDAEEHKACDIAAHMSTVNRTVFDLSHMSKGAVVLLARRNGVFAGDACSRKIIVERIMRKVELSVVRWAACHPAGHPCLRHYRLTFASMDAALGEDMFGNRCRVGPWKDPRSVARVLPMFPRSQRGRVMGLPSAATTYTCEWFRSTGRASVTWRFLSAYTVCLPPIEKLVPAAGTSVAEWESEGLLSYKDAAAALRLFADYLPDAVDLSTQLLDDIGGRVIRAVGAAADARLGEERAAAVTEAVETVRPAMDALLTRIERAVVRADRASFSGYVLGKYKDGPAMLAKEIMSHGAMLQLQVQLNREKRKVRDLETYRDLSDAARYASAASAASAACAASGASAASTDSTDSAAQPPEPQLI